MIIDGSKAGGQVLRTALGLAAITGKAIKVVNIRGGRPDSGLKTQHLQGILAVAELCNAELKGVKLGSKEIEFMPGKLEAKELSIKISTAGSIGLLFQSLQLAAAFCDTSVRIHITGGSTASAWSPPVHYIQSVLLPIVRKMGYNANIKIKHEGFYPKGGAEVEITVRPVKKLKSILLKERGGIKAIKGLSIVGNLPEHIAKRQAEAAKKTLESFNPSIETRIVRTASRGTAIVLWAECENSILGANALGKLGLPAEKVGIAAAKELLQSIESGAALDKYMADQILPFLALAQSESEITVEKITKHCLTNIAVIERLLPVKFRVSKKGEISVKGFGFEKF